MGTTAKSQISRVFHLYDFPPLYARLDQRRPDAWSRRRLLAARTEAVAHVAAAAAAWMDRDGFADALCIVTVLDILHGDGDLTFLMGEELQNTCRWALGFCYTRSRRAWKWSCQRPFPATVVPGSVLQVIVLERWRRRV